MKLPVLTLLFAALAAAQSAANPAAEAGRRAFEARCTACHGLDGAGGERGPGILNSARPAARTRQIVASGVPGTPMPAFRLAEAEMDALLTYIGTLSAPASASASPGDPAHGAALFTARCASCHMVGGRGGVLGPDLSNLAATRRLAQIEQTLLHPRPGPESAVVTVRPQSGAPVRGLLRNESGDDLQLLATDGAIRTFRKAALAGLDREPGSLMPPLSATAEEKRDLLAFLTRLTPGAAPALPNLPAAGDSRLPFTRIARPQPGEWPSYNGQMSGNRHSALTQISTANIARLAPLWISPIPNTQRLEGTPVMVDGILYVTAPNEAYALDARTGRRIWRWSRPRTPGVIGDAGSGINRGVALLGDRLFLVTDHAHLVALHRATGQLLWEATMADHTLNYGATSAPLIVDDLVLTGSSGGDEGARGFIDAYRASTGERVWRFWTIPARGEKAAETWKGRALEHGCGAPWLTGSYDPDARLVYWTTGNPCPDYNGAERQGDNLYTSSVVALDPATGALRWHFQFTPHDLHDWDAAQPVLAIDAPFHGRPRKLLAQASRNGFFYVLDRLTGEFLQATPFVHKLSWASGIGPDGRPILLPGNEPTPQGTKTCPAVEGATNWMSSAYHPGTGLFYVMALESCNIYTKSDAWWEPGKSFYGGGTKRVPGEKPEKVLRALSLETGKIAWEYAQTGPGTSWGGVLSTDGGLVFLGDDDGSFTALDARSGRPLWRFPLSQPWRASPMTYSLDGRQYITVVAGATVVAFGLPGGAAQ